MRKIKEIYGKGSSYMVKMTNIVLKDNEISMDCYKEGDVGKHFFLVVDATTFDILENSLGEPSIYARQAALKIEELSANGELPADAVSVWC